MSRDFWLAAALIATVVEGPAVVVGLLDALTNPTYWFLIAFLAVYGLIQLVAIESEARRLEAELTAFEAEMAEYRAALARMKAAA